jgi:hypothetical protein
LEWAKRYEDSPQYAVELNNEASLECMLEDGDQTLLLKRSCHPLSNSYEENKLKSEIRSQLIRLVY